LCRRGRRESSSSYYSRRTTTSRAHSAASSISTRSTRFLANPTTLRSSATSLARACSRRCSSSWRARSRMCHRRAGASIRSRNFCTWRSLNCLPISPDYRSGGASGINRLQTESRLPPIGPLPPRLSPRPKLTRSLHDEVWPDQIPTKHLEHLCAAEGHKALGVGMLPSQSENKSPRAADAIKQTANKHSLTVLKFDGVGEPVHRLPQMHWL